MTVVQPGSAYRAALFGLLASKAAATLPQTATGTLFTVTNGRVMITSITGLVTVAIGAGANLTNLVATPTVGVVNDLSGTVDIASLAAGGLLSPTGLAADALVKSTGGGISGLRNPIVVAAGTLGLKCAASNTGSVSWSVTYVPLDTGAVLA